MSIQSTAAGKKVKTFSNDQRTTENLGDGGLEIQNRSKQGTLRILRISAFYVLQKGTKSVTRINQGCPPVVQAQGPRAFQEQVRVFELD